MLPPIAEAVGAERFLHEIEIVARLQHPHIGTMFDSGEANGTLYFVMPLIVGEPRPRHRARVPARVRSAPRAA